MSRVLCNAEVGENDKVKWPQCRSAIDADSAKMSEIRRLVDERLAKLSVEHKVAQLIQAELASVEPNDIRQYGLGSVLNGGGVYPNGRRHADVAEWRNLAAAFQRAALDSDSGIPILWGTDAVHGHNNVFGATIFPHNIGLGAANDVDLMQRIGRATAADVAATGIDWTFAPTLAVPCDYRWGRTYEGYSQNPEIVARLGSAMVRGLQGNPKAEVFLQGSHVLATSKHFLGEGSTIDGIDQGHAYCSEQDLCDIHAQGHFSALSSGAQIVMAAFNSWKGEKVHGSRYLLKNVLKDQMGFEGFVVSDWDGFAQLDENLATACEKSINAGVDMLMVSADWRSVYELVLEAVLQGRIAEERLDDATRRILRVKALHGMFSETWQQSFEEHGQSNTLALQDARSLASEAVRKSLVLLKNDHQVLPLAPKQRVLIVGSDASNVAKQCGGWTLTWQGTDTTSVDFPQATSIETGIRSVVESTGGEVVTTDQIDDSIEADVAIVVFGEEPYAEGEGDLNHLSFSRENSKPLDQLRALLERRIPTVALFLTGRPRWVNPEINAANSFVVCWLPGTQGSALADVLFRDSESEICHDFVGKLPFSWPLDALATTVDRLSEQPLRYLPVGYGLTYQSESQFEELSVTDETRGAALRGPSYQGSYNYPNP